MGLWSKLFGGRQPVAEAGTALTYRVGVNETCRSLAQRFYGDGQQWERIFRDNERILKDAVQASGDPLLPGTEVIIRGARYDVDGLPVGGAGRPASVP